MSFCVNDDTIHMYITCSVYGHAQVINGILIVSIHCTVCAQAKSASLQRDIAYYWPDMHNAAYLVISDICINRGCWWYNVVVYVQKKDSVSLQNGIHNKRLSFKPHNAVLSVNLSLNLWNIDVFFSLVKINVTYLERPLFQLFLSIKDQNYCMSNLMVLTYY